MESESWRFEGTLGDDLVPSSSRVSKTVIPECHIQAEVKYLQGRRVSEQLVLGVTIFTIDKFPMLKWHFLFATLCPLPSEWGPLRGFCLCLCILLSNIDTHR